MKKLFGAIFFFFLSVTLFAQTQIIKGTITDSLGKPVKGVSVYSKGTKKGVQTDASGNFSITTKTGNTDLIISAVGYKSTIVSTNGNSEISIKLQQDIIQQDEVVVNVGYGTLKKREVSSAVSSISAKDIKDVPINNAAEALTGRLAGVQVTTSEGAPDAEVKIKVRGGGSITQSNDPLYIVDGVQVDNGLSTISPQDIQSIDVLKDAAATAIYGARGANGVIIVTTKSGKAGKLTVNFNSSIGIKRLSNELEVMEPYDFVIWEYERTRSDAQASSGFATKYGTTWDTLINYKNARKVDWQKEVLGNDGLAANNSVSVSGGNNLVTFTTGYTNNYEKAIVQNSNYKRNLFNAKIDIKPSKKLKFGVSGRYINQNAVGAGVSDEKGSSYNRLRNSVKYRPYASANADLVTDDEGDVDNVGNGLSLVNPIRLNNNEYRRKTTNSYNISANGSYNITKRFSFKTTFGYERSIITDRQFEDSLTPISVLQGGGMPVVELDTTKKNQFTNSNVFAYKASFKKKHDLDLLLGEEMVITKQDFGVQSTYKNYPNLIGHDDAFNNTSQAIPFTNTPVYKKFEYTLLSFFARANYTFNKKYIVSANFRADGSSKFADGRNWGYFPSGSVAWRISKEDFMKNVRSINDLKLRLSYGTVGNNRIDDYLYIQNFANNPYYYGINGQPVYGYTPLSLANSLLKWETTISKNIGLDISLFNDRIGLTVDYYQNKTKDLLLLAPIPQTFGYTSQLQNVGASSNKGYEIQLNATIIKKKDFSWTATFNFASNTNRITELATNQTFTPAYSGWGVAGQYYDYVGKVGEPVGAMYGLETDGFYKVSDFDYHPGATGVGTDRLYTLKPGVVTDEKIIGYPEPGMIKFRDQDGNDSIDVDHDTKIIGNATPKFSGGFNQQFTYKNWDMSIFLNFVYGNNVLNANKIEFTNGYTANSNLLAVMKDRWRTVDDQGQVVTDPAQLTALNTNAKIWRPITGSGAFQLHSWAIEDGSFLRINNISLGYNFSSNSIRKFGLKKLRVYITGNNLAVFTSYSGFDPEVNVKRKSPLTPGVDYSAYPRSRLYMFGLNATF